MLSHTTNEQIVEVALEETGHVFRLFDPDDIQLFDCYLLFVGVLGLLVIEQI